MKQKIKKILLYLPTKAIGFVQRNAQTFATESIKAGFVLVIAIISITFWEIQKMRNQVSFEKRISILSEERKDLIEASDCFTDNWNMIKHYGDTPDSENASFQDNYYDLKKSARKFDLVLSEEEFLNCDTVSKYKRLFSHESHAFFSQLKKCDGLPRELYYQISGTMDDIIHAYGKEIKKEIRKPLLGNSE